MKKKTPSTGMMDTLFWLSVPITVMLAWAAIDSSSTDLLTGAFSAGAVGLISYVTTQTKEE